MPESLSERDGDQSSAHKVIRNIFHPPLEPSSNAFTTCDSFIVPFWERVYLTAARVYFCVTLTTLLSTTGYIHNILENGLL